MRRALRALTCVNAVVLAIAVATLAVRLAHPNGAGDSPPGRSSPLACDTPAPTSPRQTWSVDDIAVAKPAQPPNPTETANPRGAPTEVIETAPMQAALDCHPVRHGGAEQP